MSEQNLQGIFDKAKKGEVQYIARLLDYGRRKGFQTIISRKLIWPFLLNLEEQSLSGSFVWDGEMDRNSNDYQQLQKDAERSLASMKTFQNITKFHLQKRQKDVLKILDSFFAKHKSLKYIQGFHDVASVFIVLFGNNHGYYLMEKAGQTYFRDFLTKDIGTLGTLISQMVLNLLIFKDPDFERIFHCFKEMNLIIFIIPWVLTWFSHVFSSVKTICRIWDYILCTGPQGIIYLTAGMILSTKQELLAQVTEFEQPEIQVFYQQKAKNESIDIEKSIELAMELQEAVALQSLDVYKTLDADSMFLLSNFETKIDLHRQAKEYSVMVEVKRREGQKKMVLAISSLTLVAGVLIAAKFYKKWPF